MSASSIVRNVLLTTFGLVEDIVTDGTNIALALTGQETIQKRERDGASATDILAWQEAVLNRNAVCDHCNAVLRTGTRAAIAVREQPGPRPILCRRCLRRVENGSAKAIR